MSAALIPPATDGLMRLGNRHRETLVRFLRRDPVRNVYLLAQIERGALGNPNVAGPVLGFWRSGHLDAAAIVGSNLALSWPCGQTATVAFAEWVARGGFRPWVVVGEDPIVEQFMGVYGRHRRHIRLERGGQPRYALERSSLVGPAEASLPHLRAATHDDLLSVREADRAMVLEELGFDPFLRDPASYDRAWATRISEGRSLIATDTQSRLVFKADRSNPSRDAVQLSGIWVHPDLRGRGLGTRGVAEVCRRCLDDVAYVSLYVHRFNAAARRAYERVGFTQRGAVRSVWFDDGFV